MTNTRSDRRHVQTPSRPLRWRLAWFVGLWAVSILALGAVGYAIRILLN
jgi:preprotein translocase subunit Sss1